jgi:hypothetical protein
MPEFPAEPREGRRPQRGGTAQGVGAALPLAAAALRLRRPPGRRRTAQGTTALGAEAPQDPAPTSAPPSTQVEQTMILVAKLDHPTSPAWGRPQDAPAQASFQPEATEEYLSIAALSARIPYAAQTIRNLMAKGVFRRGVHYVKPRGRVVFRWSAIEAWLNEGR